MSRLAALLLSIIVLPSALPHPQQNLAVTEDGSVICGSVLLTDSTALTAAHCVEGKDYAEVRCGSIDMPAEVVEASMDEDLALLRLIMPCAEARPVTLANSNPPIGADVFSTGYPRKRPRVSKGIVTSYEVSRVEPHKYHVVLVADALMWFGSSGGGLYNSANELVGITSQIDPAGFGYWIPVTSIHKFLDAQ